MHGKYLNIFCENRMWISLEQARILPLCKACNAVGYWWRQGSWRLKSSGI